MDLKLRNNSQLALTNGYIPVEYIQSSGAPNINTGVLWYHSSGGKNVIECIIQIFNSESSTERIYYAYNARGTYLHCNNSETSFYAASSKAATTGGIEVQIEGKSHIVHTRTSITINGNTTTLSGQSYGAATATIYILPNTSSTYVNIYSYKIRDNNGNLVRDYIPVISCQEGHFGEACLYDKVNRVFYYSASTGSFTASTNIYAKMITAYIKDCPNISGIDLLRRAVNLQRIRCDIGNISGSVAELLRYTALAGFTDDYQEQQIPRIIGTWTLNYWYTNEELENFQGAIDGLTVVGDGTHNVETALENDDFAIQTIDSSKPNYNPAAAIRLNANGYGHTTTNRIINNGGKFIIGKNEASTITALPVNVFRGIKTVVDENSIVTNDDEVEYDFDSFDEFKYFTGITTIAAGSSTTVLGLFGGCTKLSSIKIPYGVTTIGAYAFYDCTALSGNLILPDTVTTIGSNSLHNIPNVSNVYIPCNFSNGCINSANSMSNNILANNTGILCIKGNHNGVNVAQIPGLNFTKIFVYGNISAPRYMYSSSTFCIRVKGSANITGYALTYANGYFFEIMSNITRGSSGTVFLTTTAATNNKTICHLGYNNLVSIPCNYFGVAKTSMIYVGDGSSRANDEAILALYLADTDWNAQSAKLGTWYDYNGEYKWYYITDNLTNCTNSNPDAWPHITRGESYETTIVPDEGMTIASVTVEMLDTDTTSPTYDTMVDITSNVYDSSTGEINIPSVTGNVVITASAS